MRLSLLPALAITGLLHWSAPEASATPESFIATTSVLPGGTVEQVYYYRGRNYPYRYRGAYYRHRYYRYGRWHYY